MRDRTAMLVGLVAGAVIGGAAGWLYLTEGGRRLRADLEPYVGDLAERAERLKVTATRAERAVLDGWRTIQDVAARPPAR